MSNELKIVWKDENSNDYLLNAENLSYITPSLMHKSNRLLVGETRNGIAITDSSDRRKLTLKGGTSIKLIINNVHKVYKINNDLTFNVEEHLDTGVLLEPATSYYVYIVYAVDSASIVVSKNATMPSGTTIENSRKIGGFHTLCYDNGIYLYKEHNLYNYIAGDILPNSVWCLLHRPKTNYNYGFWSMVYDKNTNIWIDIYFNSDNMNRLRKSLFTLDLNYGISRNKRLLSFNEFRSGCNIAGQFDHRWEEKLTGNNTIKDNIKLYPYIGSRIYNDKTTTANRYRIISDIGVEGSLGCFWTFIGDIETSNVGLNKTNLYPTIKYTEVSGQSDKVTNENELLTGVHYTPIYFTVAGGAYISGALNEGTFRDAYNGIDSLAKANFDLNYLTTAFRFCADSLSFPY